MPYCLKCRKHKESKNPKPVRTKIRRITLLSKCAVSNSKNYKFIKEQEAKGLLGNLLEAKIQILRDIPLVNILFKKYKMNAIVNKFLLAGDKFMPEMHLRQPGFIYSACGPFTKNKEVIKKKLNKQETQDIFIKKN